MAAQTLTDIVLSQGGPSNRHFSTGQLAALADIQGGDEVAAE
jgi:hypothetical protein